MSKEFILQQINQCKTVAEKLVSDSFTCETNLDNAILVLQSFKFWVKSAADYDDFTPNELSELTIESDYLAHKILAAGSYSSF